MKFFGISDIGSVRELNEDCFLIKEYPAGTLFAVFDGMGGAAAGECASATARDEIESFFDDFFSDKDTAEPAAIQAALASAGDRANFKIYSLASENNALSGMGTTMVAALFLEKRLYVANVGDSRAYLIDKNGAIQLTRDHSFVQHLIDIGKITVEEARTNPNKNIITRALGADKEVTVDVSVAEPKQYRGKRLLLCSDGLSNYLDSKVMASLCAENSDCEALARAFVDKAIRLGGGDNITVIVAELD